MRMIYEVEKKGSRGLAMLLSALLIFGAVFTGSVQQVHADPGPSTIRVCEYDSSKCTVEYAREWEQQGSDWVPVWVTLNSNSSADGFGIRINPINGCRITGVTATPESIGDIDENGQPITLKFADEIPGGNPLFFNSDSCPNGVSITSISVAEAGQSIQIKAASYDNSHGKLQYSITGSGNDSDWTDIPASGIDTGVEAGFVRAIPDNGYSVSYKIDGNEVNGNIPTGLSTSPSLHYIQDISFTLLSRSLTVGAYDATGGKIQYSDNGTDWRDVDASGATVQTRYVRAVAASGYTLDSYKINSNSIYSESSQTLTADNNTLSDVSFVLNSGGGKYKVSIDDRTSGQCAATVTFLSSSGANLGTAVTGSATDIPDGTAKIRVDVTNKALLKSIQVLRSVPPTGPGEGNATEIGRPAVEEGLWQNGTVEFSASNAYSYMISITLSNTKLVSWSYREADRNSDMYVEHCKLYLLDSNGNRRPYIDALGNSVENNDHAEYDLTIGETYKFELVPDYGYQIVGLQINAYTLTPTDDTGIFSFTMSNTNFHFKGIVATANDIVSAPAAYSGAKISDGQNAVSSGNARITIKEEATDSSAAAVAGAGAKAVATVDIDLDKVVSKGNGEYWSENLTSTSGEVTMSIPVAASGLAAGETYSVVREHGATKTELPATYNSTTEMLTFGSDRFSKYTIVKKAGSPATEPDTSSEDKSDNSSSSGSSGSDDSSSTPATSAASTKFSVTVNNSTSNISSWNQLDNVLKAGGDLSVLSSAGTGKTASSGNSQSKATGTNIVSVSLTGNSITVPASTFSALDNSKVDGLHIFTNNGVALTFLKNSSNSKQGAIDIAS
ncbi:MAG: hypothetical protein K6E53_02935, partial [Lachnospiraceae bacterium]|nr:hypothetical protein [Lachnospiraceae bacterium]